MKKYNIAISIQLHSFYPGVKGFIILLLGCSTVFLNSCDKTEVMPLFSHLEINLEHTVDNDQLVLDPTQFTNEAGNIYSITDVKYYLSNITLTSANGATYYDDGIHYVDFKNIGSLSILLDSIPPGKYIAISYDLGIDSNRNITGYLSNNLNNLNMAWPDGMGGGYHFLKLEGKFENGAVTNGFAFHLGKSMMLIHYSFPLNKELRYWNEKLTLKHDVNEWFKTPSTYDFLIHQAYTMSSDSVMNVVKLNGADVFKL